jgi:non-specific protein-tyrosine kinase
LEIRRQLGIARRWFLLLVFGAVAAAGPTYFIMGRQSPMFEAEAVALPEELLPVAQQGTGGPSVDRLIDLSITWRLLADTPDVLDAAASLIGLDVPAAELAKRVDGDVDGATASLTIKARAGDPASAAALANAVVDTIAVQSAPVPTNSDELVAAVDAARERLLLEQARYEQLVEIPPPRTLRQETELAQKLVVLDSLRATYVALEASLDPETRGLVVVSRANPEDVDQLAPRAAYYSGLAALAGLFAAAALAFAIEYFDDRLRTAGDVHVTTGLPVLAAIRRRRRLFGRTSKETLPTLRDPESPLAEAFRTLYANVMISAAERSLGSVLISSSAASEGKSITAANLAVAFAQSGIRVLLVDGDLRRPSLHALFGLPNRHGLSTLLRDPSVPLPNVAYTIGQEENLRVLTSGPLPTHPAAMIGSMRGLLASLATEADLVVFDSPPLRAAVDGAILASIVDGTILVIDAARSDRAAVLEAQEQLTRARASILGTVLYRAPLGSNPEFRDYTRRVPSRLRRVLTASSRSDAA